MSTQFYDVILTGDKIFFENDQERPINGFVTCRRVEATSEEEAQRIAKHRLLIHWNQTLNADRKLGVPRLSVAHTLPVSLLRRWLRPAPSGDYYFYDSPEVQQQHLAALLKRRR